MHSGIVKNASDLLSIALQAEREAIRRYSALAQSMHNCNNKSAGALFERMIAEEKEHERLLLEWMQQEGITENPDIPPVTWSDPNVSTIYNEDARDPFSSSPYKALAFAVHNEDIAFRFYTHVAANSDNKTIQKYAEILAHEELGHAALLRTERRIAYHQERNQKSKELSLDPQSIHSEADLLATAIHIDHFLINQMELVLEKIPETIALITAIEEQIKLNEKDLNKQRLNNITPSHETNTHLDQFEFYKKAVDEDSELGFQRLWSCIDRSFSFYDTIVNTSSDEKTMLTAQKLSASALDRIGSLKKIFDD